MRVQGRGVSLTTIQIAIKPEEIRRLKRYRDEKETGHWETDQRAQTVKELLDGVIGPDEEPDEEPIPEPV